MRLNIALPELDACVRRMGATPVSWSAGKSNLDPTGFKERLRAGIEIDVDDVEVQENGLLSYRGEQVLLYIMDTRNDRDTLLHNPEKAVRYHVCDCETLDMMREAGRFQRYVVTNNLSGVFRVMAYDWQTTVSEEVQSELKVCKNCLKKINYKAYADQRVGKKKQIWLAFSIEEFFGKYSSYFSSLPDYTDESAPAPGYTADWEDVSRRFRERANWRCEKCRVSLASNRDLLHVHHKNGNKGDNSAANLAALCVLCHSKEPGHRMHVRLGDKARIIELRRTQRILA